MWSALRRRGQLAGDEPDGRPAWFQRPPRSPAGPPPSERLRIPQPLIRTRLPSGRGATEQPNVTSDGDTALSPVFWMVLVTTGIAAGLFGDLMMWILFSVEHLAFGFNAGPLKTGSGTRPTSAGWSRCCSQA